MVDGSLKQPIFYQTYQEAKLAIQELNITSSRDYRKKYKLDKRLPSAPDQLYANKGWVSWFSFLNKEEKKVYSSYAEAKLAVLKLGISSKREYRQRYKEDELLPCEPEVVYNGKGWSNWFSFLEKEVDYSAMKSAV